jgi:hypothetical protein
MYACYVLLYYISYSVKYLYYYYLPTLFPYTSLL